MTAAHSVPVPLTFKPSSKACGCRRCQASDGLASLGGHTLYPCCPPYLPYPQPTAPPHPHYHPPYPKHPTPSHCSPRTEVSFRVAMEMPHGRNVKGGREGWRGSAGVERVQPSVLEPACLKTSRGREREGEGGGGGNERKEEGGGGKRGHLCRHHSPWGLVRVCKGVQERLCGKERLAMCEFVNMCESKKKNRRRRRDLHKLVSLYSI